MRWALVAALIFGPANAWAWTEARPISAEAHAVAREDGTAEVSYRVVFAIDAGWFRGFTLAGLPTGTAIDPARSRAIDEAGTTYDLDIKSGTGERRGAFWIDLATTHGVGRGQLVVELVWTAPLRVTNGDGSTVWEWESPPWSNGMNGVTASLELPFPKERVEVVHDTLGGDELEAAQGALDTSAVEALDEGRCRVTLSTFRLPRWTSLRIRARVASPTATAVPVRGATAPRAARRPPPQVQRRMLLGIGAAVLVVLLLAFAKRRATRSVARRAGAVALEALWPRIGRVVRYCMAAELLAGGVALQLPPIGQWTAGLACVLAAMALLARRFERAILARPPGRWEALGPEAARKRLALGRRRSAALASVFDATCARGFVLGGAAVAGVAWTAHRLQPQMSWLAWVLAMDAIVVVAALWLGATRRHLPPDLGAISARMLLRHGRRAKRLLRKCGGGEFSILGRYTGERLEDDGASEGGLAPPERARSRRGRPARSEEEPSSAGGPRRSARRPEARAAEQATGDRQQATGNSEPGDRGEPRGAEPPERGKGDRASEGGFTPPQRAPSCRGRPARSEEEPSDRGGPRGAEPPELYDELRLELVPARRPEGLLSVELGVEVWCRTPRLAAILRTAAGSPAERLCAGLRGVVERHRAPGGATIAFVLAPGPDGHGGLFRDLRRGLRALARAAAAAPTPAEPATRQRKAA